MRAEILAPAGSPAALEAAVRCGADAVYFGGKTLNARRSADNFSDDELEAAVAYCRVRGVKAYLTLNTLVSDEELPKAIDFVERACAYGADALILQDIGLACVLREAAPNMPLHASTQMSVQTPAGLRTLQDTGFSRVVLPRELSRKDIKDLVDATPLETEVFVHGALCMSVSGQCYMSAILGSRSGNRGLCAGPCRLPFACVKASEYALSLKDLSLIEHLIDLEKHGVRSFKIEGRMKRPEYVAAAVTACRAALDGTLSENTLDDLRRVFSRSGFTDGYYTDRRDRTMFGVRRKDDVVSAAPVLSSLARLYEKENPRVPVDFEFFCTAGEPLALTATAREQTVTVQSKTVASPAQTRSLTEAAVETQLRKCGGTPFFAGKVMVRIQPDINAPLAAINALRRQALEDLEKRLARPAKAVFSAPSFILPAHSAQPPKIHVRVGCEEQIIENNREVSLWEVPLETPRETLAALAARVPVAVEVPRGIFGASETVRVLLRSAREAGVKTAVAGTLDGLRLALDAGFETHAGLGTNCFNSQALSALETMGVSRALLSFELSVRQAAAIKGSLPRGLLAYGRLPLMLTRCCPSVNANDGEDCRGTTSLTDRLGLVFPVTCAFGCSQVLNSVPLYMADRLNEMKNIDYMTLYFTTETREDCQSLLAAFDQGKPPVGAFTRGLYYRGVE